MNECVIIKARTGIIKNVVENIFWYTADGSEATTINLQNLVGKDITAVNRENYELKPTGGIPTNKQFNWNKVAGELSFAVELAADEQIKISYL